VLAYNDKAKGLRGWRGRRKENGPDPNGVLGFEPLFKWIGTERECSKIVCFLSRRKCFGCQSERCNPIVVIHSALLTPRSTCNVRDSFFAQIAWMERKLKLKLQIKETIAAI
jgi:hypothetical protein